MIFGDYPYRFNITLTDEDDINRISTPEATPVSSSYGYIKRAVKIKGGTKFDLDMNASYASKYNATCFNCSDVTQIFKVQVNISEIITSNKYINPLFRYDPVNEPIQITISNLSAKFNWSAKDGDGGFFNGSSFTDPPQVANQTMWNEPLDRATFNATLSGIKFYDIRDVREGMTPEEEVRSRVDLNVF